MGSKLSLNAAELPKIDEEFEEITESEELTKKEKLKTKWAALGALVGDPKRIALVSAELVAQLLSSCRDDGRWPIAFVGGGNQSLGRVPVPLRGTLA